MPRPEYIEPIKPLDLSASANALMEKYKGAMQGSKWSVWVKNRKGIYEIFYIKPVDEDEFMARRIADMVNKEGGHAEARLTEHHTATALGEVEEYKG